MLSAATARVRSLVGWRELSLVVPFLLCATGVRAQTQQLINVGPYSLTVLRGGRGYPAIVLEAGLGDSLTDWDPVFADIARLSTVVAYSRPSAAARGGPEDYNANQSVTDLHVLLSRLRLQPPYVLVGRSYGGLLVRLYTSRYPSEVAGLVLVDGTHEQQVRRWGTLDPTYPGTFRAYFDSVLAGMPRGANAAETRETVRIQAAGGVEGLRPLPNIPIAVLTSMKVDSAARYVNSSAAGHDLWRAMHDEWFRQSGNGIHIETSRSGHAIQHDEPRLVVDAIRFVLERVRSRTPITGQ